MDDLKKFGKLIDAIDETMREMKRLVHEQDDLMSSEVKSLFEDLARAQASLITTYEYTRK